MAPAAMIVLALVAAAPAETPGPAPPPCPSVDAVWADVAGLVGRARVAAPESRPTVIVDDLGARYRVIVAGREHEYEDVARDCGRRAQVAAVFVGLTLWPLAMAEPPAPAPPPPAPPAAPAPGPAVSVALAPWAGVAAASGTAGLLRAYGIALRVAIEGARLGVAAGLGADGALALAPRGVRVDERRFPLDVGARLRAGGERAAFALDVGPIVTLLAVGGASGASSSSGASSHWWELGARAGATVEVRWARDAALVPALVMGAFAEISPAPRQLALEPDGPIGRASWLRSGGILGFSLRLP